MRKTKGNLVWLQSRDQREDILYVTGRIRASRVVEMSLDFTQ